MRTFFQTPRLALPTRLRLSAGSEVGDTLLEVLISALLIALMAAATVTGLNSTDRATAVTRAASEADLLAQQDEARLRTEPVAKLSELTREETVTENGTKFVITSTGHYTTATTATSSCSAAANANYIETKSSVTWGSIGTHAPVVETGIVSPPPDTNLLVQVVDQGSAVSGMNVTATGPAPTTVVHKTETASNGCAILATEPGEYLVNVSRTGSGTPWVTPSGFTKSEEDPTYKPLSKKFLVAETTTPFIVEFGPASTLEVKFANESGPVEGDSFMVSNPKLPGVGFKGPYGTPGTYAKAITTPQELFPFKTPYSVYAGTCTEDNPEVVSPTILPAKATPVNGQPEIATVKEPPINIVVMSGKEKGSAATEGTPVVGATVRLKDTKCGTVREFKTTPSTKPPEGTLPHPNVPYGTYELCVLSGNTRYITPVFVNNTEAGPELLSKIVNSQELRTTGETKGYGVVYMGAGAPSGLGKWETGAGITSCPF
jgi:type II secretory pathway pseudopilin PulG